MRALMRNGGISSSLMRALMRNGGILGCLRDVRMFGSLKDV